MRIIKRIGKFANPFYNKNGSRISGVKSKVIKIHAKKEKSRISGVKLRKKARISSVKLSKRNLTLLCTIIYRNYKI